MHFKWKRTQRSIDICVCVNEQDSVHLEKKTFFNQICSDKNYNLKTQNKIQWDTITHLLECPFLKKIDNTKCIMLSERLYTDSISYDIMQKPKP